LGFGTLTNPGTGAMFELTDQAFARVQPLLPPTATGEPWCDHRQVLAGWSRYTCGGDADLRPESAVSQWRWSVLGPLALETPGPRPGQAVLARRTRTADHGCRRPRALDNQAVVTEVGPHLREAGECHSQAWSMSSSPAVPRRALRIRSQRSSMVSYGRSSDQLCCAIQGCRVSEQWFPSSRWRPRRQRSP